MADRDGGRPGPGRGYQRAFLDRAQTAESAVRDAALERSIAAPAVSQGQPGSAATRQRRARVSRRDAGWRNAGFFLDREPWHGFLPVRESKSTDRECIAQRVRGAIVGVVSLALEESER